MGDGYSVPGLQRLQELTQGDVTVVAAGSPNENKT